MFLFHTNICAMGLAFIDTIEFGPKVQIWPLKHQLEKGKGRGIFFIHPTPKFYHSDRPRENKQEFTIQYVKENVLGNRDMQ